MQVARTLDALRLTVEDLRRRRGQVALVPTMGALHEGHLALVRAAVRSGAGAVASIFVNPLQFGPGEDLARYPRDEAGDLALLAGCGCEAAWLPDVGTMYPPGGATTVEVGGPAEGWEGAHRPGHFRGVATAVAKLFGQVRPDLAYFGEKDWQQVQVVTRMAADLLLPTRVVALPTVRDADGLALSSRNRFLSAEERALAGQFPAVLGATADALRAGAPVDPALADARAALAKLGFAVDYLALVHAETLRRLDAAAAPSRLIAAARLGGVRLLDNFAVT